MIQKITIEEFLKLAKQYPVLDVRSPAEYSHAHIPTAHSLSLFTDEERKQVGTAYKQQSREAAIKIGLNYFGVKMRKMVEEAEKIIGNWQLTMSNIEKAINKKEQLPLANCLLLHCWRGGMRSAAVAWLLELYGFKVYLLVGGYKAYRKWVLAQFEKDYHFNIIGGYTGSGKTLVLYELEQQQKAIVDLEGLANHKGSAFGSIEDKPQPSQEMFENMLGEKLHETNNEMQEVADSSSPFRGLGGIFLEDESQRIGNLQIPMPLWRTMRKAPVFFIDIPFEERLNYITEEYGKQRKDYLKDAILRIQKRLGGLETKNAINFLEEKNYAACFRILLTYYDKWYHKGLYNRENISSLLNKIPCAGVDTPINTQKLLSCNIVSTI